MGHQRPNTRNKAKRNRTDDYAEVAAEIYRNVLSTRHVTEDDVNQLYMIWKPACQGCRVNTKDNPNCFCGLIPPPNGSRKSGLWQKISEVVNDLGPDPSDDRRASPETPAGLTNLGATCYANSILQCLYMNKSFREGVFSIEPDVLKLQPVLDQLARLFAKLHLFKMAFVDSAPFIQTLELDNGVQQDSHEFLTLLFSLLERCLSRSSVLKSRTIVQDLFRGGVSHVTTCSKCGNESEASSKIEDFYELELNVKGLKSLDESLDDYLSVEELQGDNQYYCGSCATRVDATRSIKLRSLPAVLNFQLKRCIFLPNTSRKKITSAFCFPEELNMTRRISECFQSELIYDLSAILIHKGSAANSGHYVAHIKNENTQQWWEFDDEHVSNLGCQPFGKGSPYSAAKPSQTKQLDHSSSDVIIENGNGPDAGEQQASNTDVTEVKTFSSCDAYMLMYVLRHPKDGGKMSIDSSGDKAERETCTSSEVDTHLPSHLYEEVEKLNDSYDDSCEQYKVKKESQLNCIMERRQEVRSILSKAAVQSPEKSYFWISMDWLRQWTDNILPSIIDNTSIQCTHGKVPVSKLGSMKRLSCEAWTMLFSKYGGGPTLTKDDYCIDCLFEVAQSTARADNYRDRRTLMKDLAEEALAGDCPDEKLYYISKPWLQQWLRRKNVDSPCEADAGPTALIKCPHGQLMPEQASGAKRVLIPERLWNFIREIAIAVKPDYSAGCSTFFSDSEPCTQCSIQLTEVACLEDTLREFKLKQRQSHEKLATGKSIPILPGVTYYLLPSSWLSKWKSYSNASGKSAPCAEPESLNAVIDFLMCEKHSRLLERPPDLVCKRGSILQKSPATDTLTIITDNDWKSFCEDWGGTEAKGITAEIDCLGNGVLRFSEDMAISEEPMNLNVDANVGPESRSPIIKISPEVCEECIAERKSCELMRKLNYSNEDICVCFVRGKEPPKSVLVASVNSLEPSRRTSKRSRKTAFGNSVNLNVSGSTSVYQLKMMIWEAFGIVKENQVLHKGSLVIDGESSCLADQNIFPGDVLWVTDSKIHEHRDIADELSGQKMEAPNTEEGFRGTLLSSSISSQFVSEASACLN